ncbi:unnamed protein product [Gadus morhua 'NCC']
MSKCGLGDNSGENRPAGEGDSPAGKEKMGQFKKNIYRLQVSRVRRGGRWETHCCHLALQKYSAPDPPRRYCGFRNGPAKRTRIGVHLHAALDPPRRWIRHGGGSRTRRGSALPPLRIHD